LRAAAPVPKHRDAAFPEVFDSLLDVLPAQVASRTAQAASRSATPARATATAHSSGHAATRATGRTGRSPGASTDRVSPGSTETWRRLGRGPSKPAGPAARKAAAQTQQRRLLLLHLQAAAEAATDQEGLIRALCQGAGIGRRRSDGRFQRGQDFVIGRPAEQHAFEVALLAGWRRGSRLIGSFQRQLPVKRHRPAGHVHHSPRWGEAEHFHLEGPLAGREVLENVFAGLAGGSDEFPVALGRGDGGTGDRQSVAGHAAPALRRHGRHGGDQHRNENTSYQPVQHLRPPACLLCHHISALPRLLSARRIATSPAAFPVCFPDTYPARRRRFRRPSQ